MEGRIAEVSGSSKTALSLAGSAGAPPNIGTPRAGGQGCGGAGVFSFWHVVCSEPLSLIVRSTSSFLGLGCQLLPKAGQPPLEVLISSDFQESRNKRLCVGVMK